jgi:hypothetical protein
MTLEASPNAQAILGNGANVIGLKENVAQQKRKNSPGIAPDMKAHWHFTESVLGRLEREGCDLDDLHYDRNLEITRQVRTKGKAARLHRRRQQKCSERNPS